MLLSEKQPDIGVGKDAEEEQKAVASDNNNANNNKARQQQREENGDGSNNSLGGNPEEGKAAASLAEKWAADASLSLCLVCNSEGTKKNAPENTFVWSTCGFVAAVAVRPSVRN